MGIDITFHGAAGTVTGSCIELRTGRYHILIDCGMFQGSRSLEALNYEPLAFDPATLDLVILTHAHLDHSGKLPLLIREGCRAPIWCSPPSRQLLRPLLVDAANIQAADADRRNERPDRIGLPPFEPLYDFEDVAALAEQLHALTPEKWGTPLDGISLRFWNAHHILGAVSVEINVEGQSLLFSGDIGDGATRLADPPAPAQGWDHVICEATYGDRDRSIPTEAERRELLARWLAGRAPVRGTVFLNHGEPPALDRLTTDAGAIPGLPHPVVPLLGEQFRLAPQRPAARIVAPRTDAEDLVAPGDWRNRYAAFSAGLETQLRTLPSDAARQRALAAAEAAIAKTLAENSALPQGQEPVGPRPDRTRAEAAGR